MSYRGSSLEPLVPAARRPLPQGLNIDGRPVWESPILDYHDLIGEEYEKKREAVLKYFRGDVAKATAFMDDITEYNLILMHSCSVDQDMYRAQAEEDGEMAAFFQHLRQELFVDRADLIGTGYYEFTLKRRVDGTYRVMKNVFHRGYMRTYEVTDYLQPLRPILNDEFEAEGISSGEDSRSDTSMSSHECGVEILPDGMQNTTTEDDKASATLETEDEQAAATSSNVIPNPTTGTANQSDEYVADINTSVKIPVLPLPAMPAAITSPAPGTLISPSTTNRQNKSQATITINLVMLYWWGAICLTLLAGYTIGCYRPQS